MKEKTKISAQIVADSTDSRGNRLTSLIVTFPRIILSELLTHRMLSKNTSSSRAIPFKKMVEAVQNDPFIPIAWQKHHSGMQGNEYFTKVKDVERNTRKWLTARDNAINSAQWLNAGFAEDESGIGVTKQLCNRLLEPFMWTTMLITGSKEGWSNFFRLRCPRYHYDLEDKHFYSKKQWLDYYRTHCIGDPNSNFELDEMDWFNINKGQAEIHIMDLAEKIYDAMNESTPKQLKENEWHIPFENNLDADKIAELHYEVINNDKAYNHISSIEETKVKISTAMAARVSYTVVGDEKEIDYQKQLELHDRLITLNHSSPLEHCAKAMSDEEYQFFIKGKGIPDYNLGISFSNPVLTFRENEKGWCNNYKGFIQYRYLIENYYGK